MVPKSTTAKSGTYIYNVKVCYAGGTDDSCATGYKTSYIDGGMKKIYVIVK